MALQATRPLPLTRHLLLLHRSLTTTPCSLRAYTTEPASPPPPPSSTTTPTPTPESFKIPEATAPPGRLVAPAHPPRWSQTPPAMKAPFQLDRAIYPHNKIWTVNNSPARLDAVYNRLLGLGGSKMLPEELKWLAVTHKSFDYGRRGFNDKLALMGRLTLVLEATKEIVSRAPLDGSRQKDPFGRSPFAHEQIAAVDNLTVRNPKHVVGKEKLYAFATEMGLLEVVRWKPRLTQSLESSGVEVVLNGALMAIVGAITLQHGSEVAATIVRERILARLPKD